MNNSEQLKGIYYTVTAFVIWGLVPVYFKAVDEIPPFEVVGHRVIWSALFLAIILLLNCQIISAFAIFRQPAVMLGLLVTAVVIALNWLVFIWAVANERIIETTLGYFINPLINIVFGLFVFSERLRILQWCALLFATIGVCYQLFQVGEVPWVSFVLALSFSTYSILRKKMAVDAISGLFIETLWLLPVALCYLIYLNSVDDLRLISGGPGLFWLLAFSGVVTSLPLMAFAAGARRINLSLLGFIQYIGPSIAFLIAVYYYNEPMDSDRLITFIFIWIGLAIFTVEGYLHQRKNEIVKTAKNLENLQAEDSVSKPL